MTAYYNEIDRNKAAWLRNLIEEGEIAYGVVDERSITEVQPDDLRGFTQCHFFAGVGLWSLCLRRAGWPDDRPVWTGSCPCGPFSAAGLRKGFDDPRHLWPQWFRLIRVCRPDVVLGEQSDQALAWLDLVQADMEAAGYAIGSAVIPAAGFGGAHERHRIGFVADADNAEWWSERAPWHDGRWPQTGRVQGDRHLGDGGASSRLAGVDWLLCRDSRWRPVEPGLSPLVDACPARMVRLRAYGDAIDVEAFTNLIAAYLENAPARAVAA